MERREEEMRRMAGMWEERAIEFRRMWEEALRWERASRAREERAEKLALEREEEARRREAVWEARARQMARWEMMSRRREEDARRREVETRDERQY